ncbi:hypothetical protein BDV97DRAFT_298072 [Delphinella strobiligena]|nr:hypothetical protein BDV97DRAFT_298072 [Delphinella strobiligena]
MEHVDDPSREATLEELEPSPIEESSFQSRDDYFPSSDPEKNEPIPRAIQRSSTFGLNSHGPAWYLNRIQKYSSYTFSVFTAFHIANTAIIPLVTRSVPASERYLLLTRPYYQSHIVEPLVVALPLVAHIGSGIALRLYRRYRSFKLYGAEDRKDRRHIAWPKLSGTSLLGYILTPLVLGHAFVNRAIPLQVEGGSSDIGLGYVSHAFARHPAVSFVGFGALVTIGVWHTVWGWAKWLNLSPASVTVGGLEGQMRRKRRWYLVNAVSALVAGIWLAGGLGVVGRGGKAEGYIGADYDRLYRSIPIVGEWM